MAGNKTSGGVRNSPRPNSPQNPNPFKPDGPETGNSRPPNIRPADPSTWKQLSSIKDKRLRDQIRRVYTQAIRDHGNFVSEIVIADLPEATGGYWSNFKNGGVIVLNEKHLKNLKSAANYHLGGAAQNWFVRVKNPAQATVIHETAHAIWNSFNNQGKIYNKVQNLYKEYLSDVKDRASKFKLQFPVSKYAATSVNEFWAEAYTQAIGGTRKTKYSIAVEKLLDEIPRKK